MDHYNDNADFDSNGRIHVWQSMKYATHIQKFNMKQCNTHNNATQSTWKPTRCSSLSSCLSTLTLITVLISFVMHILTDDVFRHSNYHHYYYHARIERNVETWICCVCVCGVLNENYTNYYAIIICWYCLAVWKCF